MELWVRSQNLTNLIKATRIETKRNTIIVEDYIMGEYATEERCLEIIDEIQKLLIHNGSDNDKFAQMLSGIKNEFVVYEMPQE